MPEPRISVIGAGVVGLTCAVRLAEAGYAVDVLAREMPLETVSAVAGGHWMPFLAEPADAVARWARASFLELRALSTEPATGVVMRGGVLLGVEAPGWADEVADIAPLSPAVDPAPGFRTGWHAVTPLVDTMTYLPYLVDRLRAADGTLTRLALSALPGRGLVVNCTGLAARVLATDPLVRPIRGQVVRLRNPGVTTWYSAHDDDPDRLTYVLPHARHVVVGGTMDDGEYDVTPDDDVARRILARARDLVPALRDAEVLSHRVGLRPARPRVRLEAVRGPEGTVVHCYGHGGSGVTISWGCADDVLALVSELAPLGTPATVR